MKKLMLIAALLGASLTAMAQEWSLAGYWDVRSKATNVVVLRRIGLIEKPFGSSFDLEVDGFAGSDMDTNLVAGVSLGKTFSVAQNVDFKVAIAVATQESKPTGAGLILGVTIRF